MPSTRSALPPARARQRRQAPKGVEGEGTEIATKLPIIRRKASCRYKFSFLRCRPRHPRFRSLHPRDGVCRLASSTRRAERKHKSSPHRQTEKKNSPDNLDAIPRASAAATLLRQHREELAPRGLLGELGPRGARKSGTTIVVPLVVLVVVEDGSSCDKI